MKHIKIITAIILLGIIFILPVSGAQSTAYTYTISVNGDWIRTQDAYIPSRIFMKDCDLSNPQDLFLWKNRIFVADTGNSRVVIFDRDHSTYNYLEFNEFSSPCGIFVSDDGALYVADSAAEAVFIFDAELNFKSKITRPQSNLFSSESVYQPKNVVVSSQNNIFVVGLGAYEGIMQFDVNGEFQGYFAANKRNLTAYETMQKLILSEDQIDSLSDKIPNAIYNIDITDRDLIYSVTQTGEGAAMNSNKISAKTENSLKLHNMAGTNILSVNEFMNDEWNFVDVASGLYDNSYAITQTGLIYEYDSNGNILFSFGGRAIKSDSYGLISVASAIDTDDSGIIFVLDSERAIIQTFAPTDFATITHKAIYQMNTGKYSDAEKSWNEILQMNSMSKIAHVGYGRTLMRQQNYSKALEHFKLANDKSDYSECFWELRDRWISSNMIWFIVLLVMLCVFVLLKDRFIKKKPKKSNTVLVNKSAGGKRLLGDMNFSFYMLRHPIDGYYYLKRSVYGSTVSATVLYIFIFLVFLLDNLGKAFIFSDSRVSDSFPVLVILYFACVFLWVIGNYMVCTINDGEGSLKNIYITAGYSLTPYLVITPIKVILTYVFTNNEAFFISMLSVIAIGWSVALLFTGIIKTQNYTFKEAVKNVLLTLGIMILAIVAVAIVYLIWTQLISFVSEVVSEVVYLV